MSVLVTVTSASEWTSEYNECRSKDIHTYHFPEDKGKGYIQIADEKVMEVGKGYWILMDEAKTHSLTGSIINEYNLSVQDGWYMIGGCSLQAKASVDSGNIRVIYGYEQGSGYKRVLESEHLESGKGDWIQWF